MYLLWHILSYGLLLDKLVDQYLKNGRSLIAAVDDKWHTLKKLRLFMGNEAMDLDSVVCSLVYSFYTSKCTDDEFTNIVYFNIPAEQFRIKNDSKYVLEKYRVDAANFIFRDSFDLLKAAIDLKTNLEIVLLDFNFFVGDLKALNENVVSIIDHHDVHMDLAVDHECMLIEPVGSCSTLVADKIFINGHGAFFHDYPDCVTLLLSAMCVDTINFDASQSRTTGKDVRIRDKLLGCLSSSHSFNTLAEFNEILAAKNDTTSFTIPELLLMDQKRISSDDFSIAISSIGGVAIASLYNRTADYEQILNSYLSSNQLDMLVLMNLYQDNTIDSTQFKRDLVFVSNNKCLLKLVKDMPNLNSLAPLKLEHENVPLGYTKDNIVVYKQGNIKSSRKVVLPMLQALINNINE